jgi:predicted RNA-binding Zn-ribbon protein involved in translation (DUF1610 family)
MGSQRKLTQAEMLAEAGKLFGPDPLGWAFRCPNCGDTATGRDFREALAAHPRQERGEAATASDLLGQECIGRTLGALAKTREKYAGRGCDWAAYGLFRGPWQIIMPDGHSAWSFPLAPAPVPAASTETTGA